MDFLIIGQGLAGTLLAHFLLESGRTVHLIDPGHPQAASRVAAGLINPITGRRFVKSWRIDDLLPVARQTYRVLEERFGVSLFYERALIRSMFSVEEENDWLSRTGDPAYAPYLAERAGLGAYDGCIEPARAYGEVRQAAQVDLGGLVSAYRQWFRTQGMLTETPFHYEHLNLSGQGARYAGMEVRRVVFCEGAWGKATPFFNYLPFQGDKGEVLLVRFPAHTFEKILKHRVFIVPLTGDLYWIGSTYQRQFEQSGPTGSGRNELLRRLRATLRVPFEVVEHRAAVRPTVRDRRPLLGLHPRYPQLAIFNGLGTKGASLGPFFARQLAGFLLAKGKLDDEVSISRFRKG